MANDYEIAVLGGGISGLAVALLACKQGKRVCLIEKADCGEATSNNSLRIIHGGLRYLQKLDFPRIVSSVADQTYCLKKWPEFIQPLRCVAPLSGKGLKRANLARIASVLYSCFLGALNSPLEKPYVDPRKSFEGLPFLAGLAPHGFLVWQDALLLDHKLLVQALVKEIKSLGAEVIESTKVKSLEDKGSEVIIHCEKSDGSGFSLQSKYAVNCLGAWINQIKSPFTNKWCVGFNVVLKKQYSPNLAFGCDGEQGRYFFFVPRENKTVLGTAYLELQSSPDNSCPPQEEIEKFILSASRAAPQLGLSMEDVDYIEFGILPMKGLNSNGEPALFGGSQTIKSGNVVHVLSTKYTTFRSQAAEALKYFQ